MHGIIRENNFQFPEGCPAGFQKQSGICLRIRHLSPFTHIESTVGKESALQALSSLYGKFYPKQTTLWIKLYRVYKLIFVNSCLIMSVF